MVQILNVSQSGSALKKKLDSDRDPDTHWEEQLDPDPQKMNADSQPCSQWSVCATGYFKENMWWSVGCIFKMAAVCYSVPESMYFQNGGCVLQCARVHVSLVSQLAPEITESFYTLTINLSHNNTLAFSLISKEEQKKKKRERKKGENNNKNR